LDAAGVALARTPFRQYLANLADFAMISNRKNRSKAVV
jgi:hypothetical protein